MSITSKAAVVFGVDVLARSCRTMFARLKAPILRKNISAISSNQRANWKDLADVESTVLRTSIRAHWFQLVVMIPITAYALLITAKGMAALLVYGVLTSWFLNGIPLAALSGSIALVSFISLRRSLAVLSTRKEACCD